MTDFFDGPNVEHYTAIGMIAANWAALEHVINEKLWALAKLEPKHGACLTTQIQNIHRRMEALAALVKLRGGSPELLTKINAFGTKAYSLQESRHRAVHDPWKFNHETQIPERLEITTGKKKGLNLAYVPMPHDTLEEIAQSMADLVWEFMDVLWQEIVRELGPLPDMLPPTSP